jgi:hypothetical protein
MINGSGTAVGSGPCPQGAINSPCTVTVSKGSTSASSISAANIDLQWSAIAAGNKRNAVWHCNDDTADQLDQLAVSGQWSETIYIAAGRYGNEFALIKGRPLIPSECCPVIGSPGDLICVDWTDYVLTYVVPKPTNNPLAVEDSSPLSFNVTVPDDQYHSGMVGLPPDAVESRVSDQKYFDTDSLGYAWKIRADGHFLWNSTMTNINGAVVGPCAVIAQR